MRWAFVLCLVGCYDPKPFPGSPCSETEPCPSTQQCVAGFCAEGSGGNGADAPGDEGGFDGTPTPTDRDGDGFEDVDDNCPDDPNDQGNEDGDALGDECDPCPIDGNNTDSDLDGVGDACDPHPGAGGDSIAAFSGFHHGVPSGWTLIGMGSQVGDDVELTTVAGNHTALVPPVQSIANGTVIALLTVTAEPPDNACGGPCDAASTVVMTYDPQQDQGVFCELYSPVAGSANNRSISLWDSVPQIERARNGFNWALNIAYKVSLTRQNNQYACASTDGGTGTKNANNQTNSTPGDKPAVALYGTNARVSYVLVIQSP